MNGEMMEEIYDTLMGNLVEEYRIAGVDNAFAPGEPCEMLYAQVYEAYHRMYQCDPNLDNEDVECIINNLLEICRILGYKMFEYGIRYARNNIDPAD